jgi:hypothetical protein
MPRDSAAADRPASYLVGTAAAFLLFFRDRTKLINQLPFSPSAKFPKSGSSCESRVNKGESRNSLARAVFIHRLGEIRDRTYENQQHRASGLNLLVTAIILWNTRYLNRAIAALREVEDVPDRLLVHLSPLGWEHVNLTGDYIWASADQLAENRDGFRPLRPAPALLAA